MSSLVFAALLAAATPTASSIVLEAPGAIRLDGNHYAIGAGAIEVDDGTYLATQSLAMQDCVRPDGASQALSDHAWRWTGGLRVVYLSTDPDGIELEYRNGAWTVALESSTGDVECAGKIAEPGVVFSSGFE